MMILLPSPKAKEENVNWLLSLVGRVSTVIAGFHRPLFWFLVLLLPFQLGKHFWPESAFIFGVRIDYLSPTIYLTDLLILGILGSWVIDKLKIKNEKFKITVKNLKFFSFLALFFSFLLLSSLASKNFGVAFYKLIKVMEFTFLGIYIVRNNLQLTAYYLPLTLSVAYSSLMAIAQFLKQGSQGGIFWWFGERTFSVVTPGIAQTVINGELLMRPYATFSHPNVLAGFLSVGLVLTLVFWWKKNRLLATGYSLLVASAIILSFSRSALMTMMAASSLFLVFENKRISKGRRYFLLGLILIGLALIINWQPFNSDSINQRISLNEIAFSMMKTSPLIGVGLNNFLPRLPAFLTNQGTVFWLQPVHNIFLLVAAETGLFGLIIFLWFLGRSIKKAMVVDYQLLISLCLILFIGFFDHYWLTLQQTQLLFVIVLGWTWSKNSSNEVK